MNLQTPSQTVGPFFAYGLTARQYGYDNLSIANDIIAGPRAAGEHVEIIGKVLDGHGGVIPDAIVEFWHADAGGQYLATEVNPDSQGFKGIGRMGTGTDHQGRFIFKTIKPGRYDGQVPHINIILLMRGLLSHLYTRLYFSDENNSKDEILNSVPESRRATLIAERKRTDAGVFYLFDIVTQGKKETVFFDV